MLQHLSWTYIKYSKVGKVEMYEMVMTHTIQTNENANNDDDRQQYKERRQISRLVTYYTITQSHTTTAPI